MPRKSDYSDDLLRMATTHYHGDGLGQAEVARLVRVSQAEVSRLLGAALERGIVRISVEQYEARESQLEHAIGRRCALKSAVVVCVAAAPNAYCSAQLNYPPPSVALQCFAWAAALIRSSSFIT